MHRGRQRLESGKAPEQEEGRRGIQTFILSNLIFSFLILFCSGVVVEVRFAAAFNY